MQATSSFALTRLGIGSKILDPSIAKFGFISNGTITGVHPRTLPCCETRSLVFRGGSSLRMSSPRSYTDGIGGNVDNSKVWQVIEYEDNLEELRNLLMKSLNELIVVRVHTSALVEKTRSLILSIESSCNEAAKMANTTFSIAKRELDHLSKFLENSSCEVDHLVHWTYEIEDLEAELDTYTAIMADCEAALGRLQRKKDELRTEISLLQEIAKQDQLNALQAKENLANIMLIVEQAAAIGLEAAERVKHAKIQLEEYGRVGLIDMFSDKKMDSTSLSAGELGEKEVPMTPDSTSSGPGNAEMLGPAESDSSAQMWGKQTGGEEAGPEQVL